MEYFLENRIIVLTDPREEIWNLTHSRHQGIENCIARAREHIYWSGITAEIKDMVSNSSTCFDEPNQHPTELMNPTKFLKYY